MALCYDEGMKSNILYVLYGTFARDILFWIVVNNLFLTTVKGMSEFNVILITILGLAFSLVLFPFVGWLLKKFNNHASIIIGEVLSILSIVFFTVCNSVYLFALAETIYCVAAMFKQPSAVMLKNNLCSQGKEDQFVKWESFAKLGYAIITTAVAAVSGIFFNISPYLPMYLAIACSFVGFVFACLYTQPKQTEAKSCTQVQKPISLKKVIFNKMMILIFLMNLITVGTYTFFHTKSTLLLQNICQNANLSLASISLIVSGVVLASRIMRVIANFVAPYIYKKTKRKSHLLMGISACIVVAGVLFALGGNLKINVAASISFIALGLLIVISIRDLYSTLEKKMVVTNLPEASQSQGLLLGKVYGNCGRLLLNCATLFALSLTSLNVAYLFLLIFAVGQVFISLPLSKFLNTEAPTDTINNAKQDDSVKQMLDIIKRQ